MPTGPMALPGSVTQQPQQPGGDLYDLLAKRIAESLSGPMPQAPRPPQPQALSPVAAFAVARNPQSEQYFTQQANAPEMARYGQQQAAFEAAMSGREKALSAGVSLEGGRMRMGGLGGRPALGTIEIDGVRTLVNVVRAPDGTATIQPLGPAPWAPGNVAAVPGVSPQMTFPRGGNQPGPATPVPGAPTPPAPPSVEEDYRKNQAFIAGTNRLRQSFRDLKTAMQGRSAAGSAIGQELGETKYGGAIPFFGAQAVNKFESELRTNLDTMIVAVTGLSFPEQAFRRYRSELPVATDTEEQAMQKIDNVVRKFIAEQKSMERVYPNVGGGTPSPAADPARDLFREMFGREPEE